MTHIHSNFSRWVLSHVRACQFAFDELIRSPIVNITTIFVIGIAIALPLGFFVLLQNLQTVDATWNTSAPMISLYLKSNISQSTVNSMMQTLRNNSQISNVNYVSPRQGKKSFEKNTPFSNVLQLFQHNPIPGVITVLPNMHHQTPTTINNLFLSLKTLPLVDTAQLDMSWVMRLFNIVSIGKQMTKALSLLFGFGVILIIGHALRASLANHMKEIQVMKLVGATNHYIRRPLLYRGVLYGLLGGIFSWALINIFLWQLQKPVSQLALSYHASFQLRLISFSLGFEVLLLSTMAGLISAFFMTTQFLKQSEQMH